MAAAVPQFPLLSDDVRRLMLTSQTREGIEEAAGVIREDLLSIILFSCCRVQATQCQSTFFEAPLM